MCDIRQYNVPCFIQGLHGRKSHLRHLTGYNVYTTYYQHSTHRTYTRMDPIKPPPTSLAFLNRMLSSPALRPALSLKMTLRNGGEDQSLSSISLTALSYTPRPHTRWNFLLWLVHSAYRHWTSLGALWRPRAPMPSRFLICSRTDIGHSAVPRVIIAYRCNVLTTTYATNVRCHTMLPVMLSGANRGTAVTGRRTTGETS